jgi:hypothetical protein
MSLDIDTDQQAVDALRKATADFKNVKNNDVQLCKCGRLTRYDIVVRLACIACGYSARYCPCELV